MASSKMARRMRQQSGSAAQAGGCTRWGTSPSWFAAAAIAAIMVVAASIVYAVIQDDDQAAGGAAAPLVGGDLHALYVADGRRFVSGHEGAAFSDSGGMWHPIEGLAGKDAMAWTGVPGALLVGGHQGLYVSTDGGATFAISNSDLPVRDVHALGAAGETVYLASPEGGLFVSTDGGETFSHRSAVGVSFMGRMLVDPSDTAHVLAPDMANGVAETRDGGMTWHTLGGPPGVMSIAWDPHDQNRLVAAAMGETAVSSNGGRSWEALKVPNDTMAITFDDKGRLLAGSLRDDRAEVYLSADGGGSWTRV